jgi:hypothetical protein
MVVCCLTVFSTLKIEEQVGVFREALFCFIAIAIDSTIINSHWLAALAL